MPTTDNNNNLCQLELGEIDVLLNKAYEGGGLKWGMARPKFKMSTVRYNTATFYGNDFAANPIKLVRFISKIIKDEEVYGERARDRYDFYKYLVPGRAPPPINDLIAEFSTTQMIKNV